jgi:hypothetical protein
VHSTAYELRYSAFRIDEDGIAMRTSSNSPVGRESQQEHGEQAKAAGRARSPCPAAAHVIGRGCGILGNYTYTQTLNRPHHLCSACPQFPLFSSHSFSGAALPRCSLRLPSHSFFFSALFMSPRSNSRSMCTRRPDQTDVHPSLPAPQIPPSP